MPTEHTVIVWESTPTDTSPTSLSIGEDLIASVLSFTDVDDSGTLAVGDSVGGEAITYIEIVDLTLSVSGPVSVCAVQTPSTIYLIPLDGSTPTAEVFTSIESYTGVSSADISLMCFLPGTRIKTPQGDAAVECLKIGDLIATADGRQVPVKWIGRQTVRPLLSRQGAQPVRIRAGALGDGLPNADLTVTADHGMVLDGHVINASALVNGTTIDFVPLAELEDSFTVYHVETENHDVILANGAPAETFIDYRDRRAFDNFDEYLDLYGCERIIPEMPAPRISSARHLPMDTRVRLGIGRLPSDTGTAISA
ncbi:Hint domain-containing protein [Mameliella sp.]|uniref:Hint domain-containing protein n=1 Tax=Mameliella sp. TaxID=1924940 RepID=UPI003BA97402